MALNEMSCQGDDFAGRKNQPPAPFHIPPYCAQAFAALRDAIEAEEGEPFYNLMIFVAARLLAKPSTRAKVSAVIAKLDRHSGGAS